jgi:hypothetical protein
MTMTRLSRAAGIAGILAAVLATAASDVSAASVDDVLRETEAVMTPLGGDAFAVTYWVSEPDGWHVVTTVDTVIAQGSEAERHAIVRFSAVLQPGQSQLILVPVAVGERQQTLRIRRVGDRIKVVATVDGA